MYRCNGLPLLKVTKLDNDHALAFSSASRPHAITSTISPGSKRPIESAPPAAMRSPPSLFKNALSPAQSGRSFVSNHGSDVEISPPACDIRQHVENMPIGLRNMSGHAGPSTVHATTLPTAMAAAPHQSGFADLPPRFEDLDPEVLAAMPEEYRQEVLQFYGEAKRAAWLEFFAFHGYCGQFTAIFRQTGPFCALHPPRRASKWADGKPTLPPRISQRETQWGCRSAWGTTGPPTYKTAGTA